MGLWDFQMLSADGRRYSTFTGVSTELSGAESMDWTFSFYGGRGVGVPSLRLQRLTRLEHSALDIPPSITWVGKVLAKSR